MLNLVIHLLTRSLKSFGKWVFQERIYQKMSFFSSLLQFQIIFVHTNLNLRPLLSITFPKDSKNQKSLDIEIEEVGAKRH
jgi:hypothetical protein